MAKLINTIYAEDLASTTAYIYSELMENPSFFSNIDKAMTIAKSFIEKFPTGTNWEKQENTWEEEMYIHFNTNK